VREITRPPHDDPHLEQDGAIRMERAWVVVLDVKALERWSESNASSSA
jgi:hypothetical protein